MILELSIALSLLDYIPLLAFFPLAALIAPVASSLLAPAIIAPTVAPIVAGTLGPIVASTVAPTVAAATGSIAGAGATGALTGGFGQGVSAAAGGFGPIEGVGSTLGASALKGLPGTVNKLSTIGPDETVNQVSTEVGGTRAADGSGGPVGPAGALPEGATSNIAGTTPAQPSPVGGNIGSPAQPQVPGFGTGNITSPGDRPGFSNFGGGLDSSGRGPLQTFGPRRPPGTQGFGSANMRVAGGAANIRGAAGTDASLSSFDNPGGFTPNNSPTGQQLAKAGIQLIKQVQTGLVGQEEQQQQSQAPGLQPGPRRSGPVVQGEGRADATLQLLQALRNRQQPRSSGIRRGLT